MSALPVPLAPKRDLQSLRSADLLGWRSPSAPDLLPTGIPAADALLGGCPRGRITEITGPPSSGRTTVLHSVLATASRSAETCALVDASDSFDPISAARAGLDCKRLHWVRCGGSVEHAMRAADLLLASAGFGVIALDFCDLPASALRRIPQAFWFRFRRAVEDTPAVFLVLAHAAQARSCAALSLDMKRRRAEFSGGFPVLRSIDYEAISRKPVRADVASFRAIA
ncbi:MAG: hypothetical protein ABI823_04955 [Bryobacteraceae bacterium]